MLTKFRLFVVLCFSLLSIVPAARANTHDRFTLILDFNTCVTDPTNSNIFNCQEKDGTGQPVGLIRINIFSITATDGTCAINPLCSFTDHASYFYQLNGGSITVANATEWQGQTTTKDENGVAPYAGFSQGAITAGTGRYHDAKGTLTMRRDANVAFACSI